jgi:hypothetical protein
MTLEEKLNEFSLTSLRTWAAREKLLQLVAAAVEEEREACAKIADAEAKEASTYQWAHAAEQIAENIRARGEVKK